MHLHETYLVVGINKVLNLCLCELANAQETGARGDLIPV